MVTHDLQAVLAGLRRSKSDVGCSTDGYQCFCGSNFALGQGNWVSGDTCNAKCSGDATETVCGFWNGATVFNVTTKGYKEEVAVKPPGYMCGCVSVPSA